MKSVTATVSYTGAETKEKLDTNNSHMVFCALAMTKICMKLYPYCWSKSARLESIFAVIDLQKI